MPLTKWIAVDFDHTLVYIDTPLPGAREGMQELKALGYSLMIHSCNNVEWIEKVLRANDIPYDYIWNPADDRGKPVCHAYIDDRGVGFTGDWAECVTDVVNLERRRKGIKTDGGHQET